MAATSAGAPAGPDALTRLFPEVGAGGFSRIDGTVQFYVRINALLRPEMTVLDFGAGRGEWTEDPVVYRRELRTLRGKVERVVGVDVDPVVTGNPGCDEAVLLDAGSRIPLADSSVDLVVSDHTFEHLDDPVAVTAELDRVLRPGGWICARTPNRWGYIGVGARLVPNAAHAGVLRRVQPGRQDRDVFPVRYRINSRRDFRRCFPASRFDVLAYTVNAEPWYFGRSRIAWRVALAVGAVLPQALGAKYMVFIRKK